MVSLSNSCTPEAQRAILESLEEFVGRSDEKTFGSQDGTDPDYFITLWWSHYTESRQITVTPAEPGGKVVNFNVPGCLDPITCLNEIICACNNARPGLKPAVCLSEADAAEWAARDPESEFRLMRADRIEQLAELMEQG